jgi:hypothetical protein
VVVGGVVVVVGVGVVVVVVVYVHVQQVFVSLQLPLDCRKESGLVFLCFLEDFQPLLNVLVAGKFACAASRRRCNFHHV